MLDQSNLRTITGLGVVAATTLGSVLKPCNNIHCAAAECERANTVTRKFEVHIATDDPECTITVHEDAFSALVLGAASTVLVWEESSEHSCGEWSVTRRPDGDALFSVSDGSCQATFQATGASHFYLDVLGVMYRWTQEGPSQQDRHDRSYGVGLPDFLATNNVCMDGCDETSGVTWTCHDETNETPEDLERILAKTAALQAAQEAQRKKALQAASLRKLQELIDPKGYSEVPLYAAMQLDATIHDPERVARASIAAWAFREAYKQMCLAAEDLARD